MRTALIALLPLLAACSPAAQPTPSEAPASSASVEAPTWATLNGAPPLVIAHRGASGERPEHTVSAYALALDQGADVIEPDLQISADGVMIVRHDAYLSTSTDIADRPEFADRKAVRFDREDWWVVDFTAAELRTLLARQVITERSDAYDDQDHVLTFADFLDFVAEREALCGCVIPIEPEVKEPSLYAAEGLDPLPIFLGELDARGLNRADAAIVVQSFDPDFLQRLRPLTELPLAMLYYGPDEEHSDAGGLTIEEIAAFADGVGAYKGVLINPDGTSTGYLEAAHALGLEIHTWTIRDDREPHTGATVEDELRALFTLGVDAVFTDHPATAVRVRADMAAEG